MSLQVGQSVRIRTDRQYVARFSGSEGEFLGLIGRRRDIAVVRCERFPLNFYLDEIEAVTSATEGGVQI